MQLAICTVFFTFIGGNVVAVLKTFFPISVRVVMTLFLAPIVLLSLIPNLKVLSPVTVIGMTFLFVTFTLLGIVIFFNWDCDSQESPGNVSISKVSFPKLFDTLL